MRPTAIFVTLLAYYAVALVMLLGAFLSSAQGVLLTYTPVLLSLVLLMPIYVWQREHRRNAELLREVKARDANTTLFWVFALFALALSIRIPSVLLFNEPYEKAPLIYLLVLMMLLVEKTDLSAFGFRTERLAKSLLYGLIFFVIFGGVALIVQYGLIYGFVGQVPVQSYDPTVAVLAMPFMTLSVGISEEGLFRGYMQSHFEKVFTARQAILAQAMLFGAWHFVWNLYPFAPIGMAQYVVNTAFIGLLFGYFFSKSRNLVPLIFAHGLWNSIPLGIIENSSAMASFSTYPWIAQIAVWIVPFLVSATVTVLFIRCFMKRI